VGQGTKLRIAVESPLRILFDGFCNIKNLDNRFKRSARLVRRLSDGSNGAPLELDSTAAAQGIGEGAEMNLVNLVAVWRTVRSSNVDRDSL